MEPEMIPKLLPKCIPFGASESDKTIAFPYAFTQNGGPKGPHFGPKPGSKMKLNLIKFDRSQPKVLHPSRTSSRVSWLSNTYK